METLAENDDDDLDSPIALRRCQTAADSYVRVVEDKYSLLHNISQDYRGLQRQIQTALKEDTQAQRAITYGAATLIEKFVDYNDLTIPSAPRGSLSCKKEFAVSVSLLTKYHLQVQTEIILDMTKETKYIESCIRKSITFPRMPTPQNLISAYEEFINSRAYSASSVAVHAYTRV